MASSYDWQPIEDESLLNEERFPNRSVRGLKMREKRLVICKVDGEFFALDGICPHAGAGLSAGWCSSQRDSLVCPLHRFEFDLNTGNEISGNCGGLGTYPVKVEDGKLWIGFERKKWIFW